MNDREYPAPWHLSGQGYIILFRLAPDFVASHGFVPEWLKSAFVGGVGSMMLVDYRQTDVGPYGELLFIPGRFRVGSRVRHSITKIYVSSPLSVEWGRRNWGIPKELAGFSFEATGPRTERCRVTLGGRTVADLVFKTGVVPFPVTTAVLPLSLAQNLDRLKLLGFGGRGVGRLAKLVHAATDPTLFPDLGAIKPLAVVRVSPFSLCFEKATEPEA